MKALAFQQVDVFTTVPFKGNPVAVVLDADALSGEQMQSIAAWTNLSETTFVCMPTGQRADYRLRIFTPRRELPFAGHPTIGSAHAVVRRGFKPRTAGLLVQECGKVSSTSRSRASGYSSRYPSQSFVNQPNHMLLRSRIVWVSPRPTYSAQRSSMSDPCGSPFNSRAVTPSELLHLTWASSRR
jgi:predicted PhzF superfamily epimerase YddE/YHI9